MGVNAAYIGAYWGARAETVSACAARLGSCLAALESVAPDVWGRWKPKGRSRSAAISSADVEVADLETLLLGGVNRRDVGGEVMEELGFSWSAWNGLSSCPSSVSVTCGASVSAARVLNSFVVELPHPDDEGAAPLYEPGRVASVISAAVQAWEPDFAVATSHVLRMVREWEPAQPVVGWITYLRAGRSSSVPLELAEAESLAGGTLLRIPRRWDAVQPSDVEALAAVLDEGGALTPVG